MGGLGNCLVYVFREFIPEKLNTQDGKTKEISSSWQVIPNPLGFLFLPVFELGSWGRFQQVYVDLGKEAQPNNGSSMNVQMNFGKENFWTGWSGPLE